MKILIFGYEGYLGTNFLAEADRLDFEINLYPRGESVEVIKDNDIVLYMIKEYAEEKIPFTKEVIDAVKKYNKKLIYLSSAEVLTNPKCFKIEIENYITKNLYLGNYSIIRPELIYGGKKFGLKKWFDFYWYPHGDCQHISKVINEIIEELEIMKLTEISRSEAWKMKISLWIARI